MKRFTYTNYLLLKHNPLSARFNLNVLPRLSGLFSTNFSNYSTRISLYYYSNLQLMISPTPKLSLVNYNHFTPQKFKANLERGERMFASVRANSILQPKDELINYSNHLSLFLSEIRKILLANKNNLYKAQIEIENK